jgi:hypothetical protein
MLEYMSKHMANRQLQDKSNTQLTATRNEGNSE